MIRQLKGSKDVDGINTVKLYSESLLNALLNRARRNPYIMSALAILSSIISLLAWNSEVFRNIIKFAWNCFLKPVRGASQKDKLDSFYAGQAGVYDATRSKLLKGRETMLQLAAAELKVKFGAEPSSPRLMRKPRVWVDIGGGTGWNIETMDDYIPLSSFDAIYLVDLCEPLLQVARKRFARKGWKNVHVVHCDASRFVVPDDKFGRKGKASLVTMSYSLSMIPPYHATIDGVSDMLDADGIVGVVDFYAKHGRDSIQNKLTNATINKDTGLFATWFWTTWFSFDHVHLRPERMEYLQHRFEGRKVAYARNGFLIPYLIKIPYYIYLGEKADAVKKVDERSAAELGFRMNNGLLTPNSPWSQPKKEEGEMLEQPNDFSLGASAWSEAAEVESNGSVATVTQSSGRALSSKWRIAYDEQEVHKEFRTHIYGWTWEDPACDVEKLKIQDGDSLLVITSAGDNVLHYAIKANVKVQSVDMNPCQGHILELKLAATRSLEYDDFWKLFGEGCHPNFQRLLDSKISPYLSAPAYAYWKANVAEFETNWFMRGYSGWAIRLANFAFALAGVAGDVQRFINADSTYEQQKIWGTRLRRVILNPAMRAILASPIFCWNALGVPRNQLRCLLQDGDIASFIAATFDPLPGLATFKNGAYHYFLCLNGKYTRASCPLYLTPEGFHSLKARSGLRTNGIQLHTDTILQVLSETENDTLTKIIVMDSLDWFDPIPESTTLPTTLYHKHPDMTPEAALELLKSELDYEILEMKRVLKKGGMAVWRSAGKYPWYRKRFEMAGFEVEAIDIREDGKAIDRVNMYASFWKATKV